MGLTKEKNFDSQVNVNRRGCSNTEGGAAYSPLLPEVPSPVIVRFRSTTDITWGLGQTVPATGVPVIKFNNRSRLIYNHPIKPKIVVINPGIEENFIRTGLGYGIRGYALRLGTLLFSGGWDNTYATYTLKMRQLLWIKSNVDTDPYYTSRASTFPPPTYTGQINYQDKLINQSALYTSAEANSPYTTYDIQLVTFSTGFTWTASISFQDSVKFSRDRNASDLVWINTAVDW